MDQERNVGSKAEGREDRSPDFGTEVMMSYDFEED